MSVLKLLVTTPLIWILGFLIAAIIVLRGLRQERRWRFGWRLLVAAAALFLVFSSPLVSSGLVYLLERQYPSSQDAVLQSLDFVVILGGGVRGSGRFQQKAEPSGATYTRLFNGVEIFKQSGAEKLILSGAAEEAGQETNAEVMQEMALRLGVPSDQIIAEAKSANTAEHASELAQLISWQEKKIGLVTSALHLPRAVGIFKTQFSSETIVPIPVGFSYRRPAGFKKFIPAVDALSSATAAMHELIGMAWYQVRY